MRHCAEIGLDVNRANQQTSHNSANRPRFLGPEDRLLGSDVFQSPRYGQRLPVAPEFDLRRSAETEFGNWQTRSDVMTSGMTRRTTSKAPPPHVQAKPRPKASPTASERRAWDATRRITSLPRSQWQTELNREIQNFTGRGRDYLEQAMEVAMMNEASFPAAFVVNRDTQDPDLNTAPTTLGRPAAHISPTATTTTADWENISNEDPWPQEPDDPSLPPRSRREIVEF